MTHRFLMPTRSCFYGVECIAEGPIQEEGDDGGKAAIIIMRYPDGGLAVFLFCAGLYFFFFRFQF